MSKNFFQDMIRTKNEIRAEMESKMARKPEPVSRPKVMEEKPKREPQPKRETEDESKFASVYDLSERGYYPKKPRRSLWLVAAVSVIFLFFAVSYAFSGAKISITPKIEEVKINQSFSAVKDGGPDALTFDLVVLSAEESKNVVGGAEAELVKSAEGRAVIYNTYSSAAQNLDINTRLEGSNGKIYKTKTKTTVPGMKGTTPGSVEVEIYGAEGGPEYNSSPLDFKIFGFKGTPKYAKFYARSKGDLTGGFRGKTRTVGESEKAAALTEIKTALDSKLLERAQGQIPAGFILFKDGAFINTTEGVVGDSNEDGTVAITMKGTIYGLLFDEKKLTKEIAKKAVAGSTGENVYIPNIKNLSFVIPSRENISLADAKTINFSVSGDTQIVSLVDEEKLVSDVLGKSKKDFTSILGEHADIALAELSLRPFWKRSFPSEREDIEVTVNYPN